MVDLGDLVRVVVGIQGQQLVSKCVGFVHLPLPLLHFSQQELRREGRVSEEKKKEIDKDNQFVKWDDSLSAV